jgi:hypothetical protein
MVLNTSANGNFMMEDNILRDNPSRNTIDGSGPDKTGQ